MNKIIIIYFLFQYLICSKLYQKCGFTSPINQQNWGENIITDTPVLFPSNDEELKTIFIQATTNKCMVRPSGATHSGAEQVIGPDTNDIIVVSLANYSAPDEWNVLDVDNRKIRMNAGQSYLDLQNKIRKHNLFLPTQTAGWIFSLAGTVSSTVHGGFYDKSFLHTYVSAIRVLKADGSIEVISGDELMYWRNSFGLLGIITAVEFNLETRDQFSVRTISTAMWTFDKEGQEAVYSLAREDNSIQGEFFQNAQNDETVIVSFQNNEEGVVKEDSDCKWNWEDLHCEPTSYCTQEQEFPDLRLSQSCRLWNQTTQDIAYEHLLSKYTDVRTSGCRKTFNDTSGDNLITLILEKFLDEKIRHSSTLAHLSANSTLAATPHQVNSMKKSLPDGFWIRIAPTANIMAYFIPFDRFFDALQIQRDAVRGFDEGSISLPVEFRINQPCEQRQTTIQKSSQMQLIPEGEQVVIEVLHLADGDDNWKWGFRQIEQQWLGIEGAQPHLGKLQGFSQTDDDSQPPEPFDKDIVIPLYEKSDLTEFNNYRKSVDPNGLFSGGYAMEFFKELDERVEFQ